MTALSLKRISAVGRANLANTISAISANARTPKNDSKVTSRLAGRVTGTMFPYPIVAIVSTLKKNAIEKARAALARHDGAESQIEIDVRLRFFFGFDARHVRSSQIAVRRGSYLSELRTANCGLRT